MNTIILYFTYAGDADVARMSVCRALELYPDASFMVAEDAAAPLPAGCMPEPVKVFRTRYDRGGTGKGLAAVLGELRTMRDAMAAAGADYCIKLDSDVWVNDLGRLMPGAGAEDFLGIEGGKALMPMGCAYRISRWAVQWCIDYMEGRTAWQAGVYAEALTMWHVLTLSRMPMGLIPAADGYLTGFYLVPGGRLPAAEVRAAGVVHCGEPYSDGGKLVRCGSELARTRMVLMALLT